MPVTKLTTKQVRVVERRRLRNRSIRSRVKTYITKAEKLIFSGELEAAQSAVVAALSSLDKAAEKGVIHPNNAARRKSRLRKKLNEAQAYFQSQTEPSPVTKTRSKSQTEVPIPND